MASARRALPHWGGEADDQGLGKKGFHLGRVDEFWRNDVFGIPELNQT
jgi:hypothetical protein